MVVSASSNANVLVSEKRSSTYLHCDKYIPFWEQATLIHLRDKYSCSCSISFMSSSMTIMSSTFILSNVTLPSLHLMNKVWSKFPYRYPNLFMAWVNLPNHALGDCLRPSKAIWSLHTFPLEFGTPLYRQEIHVHLILQISMQESIFYIKLSHGSIKVSC